MSTSDISTKITVLRAHITVGGARQLISAAHTEAARRGWDISVAVVDPAGELIAFERDDAAAGVTPQVAIAKARTAALLRAPSKVFEDFINGGLPSFLATPGIAPLQGGVPIVSGGQVIGAIGVSGAPGDEDNLMATAAIAAIV